MHRQELQNLLLQRRRRRRLLQHAAQLLNGPLALLLPRSAATSICRRSLLLSCIHACVSAASGLHKGVLQLLHVLLQLLRIRRSGGGSAGDRGIAPRCGRGSSGLFLVPSVKQQLLLLLLLLLDDIALQLAAAVALQRQ